MLTATDSFIKYLQDELAGDPPVHWVRVSSNDDTSYVPKMNHANVGVLACFEVGTLERIVVSIDVLGTNERTVLAWLKTIRDVLIKRQYVEERDFSDPSTPVALGKMVSWTIEDVSFELVGQGDKAIQYNLTMELCHTRQ